MPSSSAFYDSAGYRDALHHLLDITYFPDEPGYLPWDLILQQLNIHDLCDFIRCPSSAFLHYNMKLLIIQVTLLRHQLN